MKLKRYAYFTIVVLSTVLITLNACTKPFTDIQKIEVRNQGSFDYKEGLTLMLGSNGVDDVGVIANTDDFKLFYSINNEAAIKLNDDWITVDSTANFIDFYTSSQKPTNENFRLNISNGQPGFVGSISTIFPNPVSDTLNFVMESQTRGMITFKVFNIVGQELDSYSEFVSEDNFEHKFNFSNFQNGVYLLSVEYGGSDMPYKVVKN